MDRFIYIQDPQQKFGNPFRRLMAKGSSSSSSSPKLIGLLNTFEAALAHRIQKLKPMEQVDVVSLAWIRTAMASVCQLHKEVKSLVTALELPVSDWDDKWVDIYLDNSIKLLNISIVFSSELSRLKHGHLFLQCVLHNLKTGSMARACSSLDGWKQHISSKNPRFDKCFSILDGLSQTFDLPKVKNSAKGKVLMRAMYGVKAVTLLVCSIFTAALSGSTEKLMELQVSETYLWAEAFTHLQCFVNSGIRNACVTLKELEEVEMVINKLDPMLDDDDELQGTTSDLEARADAFSEGVELAAKEVDSLFQVVLTGRDALLCNLRAGGNFPDKVWITGNVKSQAVR